MTGSFGNFLLLPIALFTVGAGIASSQQQAPLLPADDPRVYSSFFFFMETFASWLDTRVAAVPASRTKLMQSAARYLNVDVSELPKVSATCQLVAAKLRQIGVSARQYWEVESNSHRAPDVTRVRDFEAQRQSAIQDGISELQRELSTSGWNGLREHVNGVHRAGIQSPVKSRP